jgi:hypothetical protein
MLAIGANDCGRTVFRLVDTLGDHDSATQWGGQSSQGNNGDTTGGDLVGNGGDGYVNQVPTVRITGPAADSVFELGRLVTLRATATDETPDDLTVSWESDLDGVIDSDPPDASGDISFALDTLSAGTHLITITVSDPYLAEASDNRSLRINVPPTVSCDAPLDATVFEKGWEVLVEGQVGDAEDDVTTLMVEWVSNVDGSLGSNPPDGTGAVQLAASSLSIGSHQVTLQITDSDGAFATDLCNFSVEEARSYVFLTSGRFYLDIGSLAAADALCAQAASDAGIPGTFVAWLSDSTTNAIDRIPASAGPWYRLDKVPFARDKTALATDRLLSPPHVDELGVAHCGTPGSYIATGTLEDGSWAGAGNDCGGWADLGANVTLGTSCGTGGAWTEYGFSSCGSQGRLCCLQTEGGRLLEFFAGTHRRIFVTDGTYLPVTDFNSLAQADALCSAEASSAGLPGTYRAIIADSGTNAIDRIPAGGPYVRPDGMKVADDKPDLFDLSALYTSLNVTPTLAYLTRATIVWTGADDYGMSTSANCANWTNTGATGHVGRPTLLSQMYEISEEDCIEAGALYCVQE